MIWEQAGRGWCKTRSTRLGSIAALSVLAACGVEKLPVEMGASVPPDIQAIFDGSCNGTSAGCHLTGAGGLFLSSDGAFIDRESNTGKAVIPGDVENSLVMVRIEAGEMPIPNLGYTLSEVQSFAIAGWIAQGAELVEGDGGATGPGVAGETMDEASEGMSLEGVVEEETTSDPMTEESGSEGSATDGTSVEYDAFAPVLEILQASCSGAGCHRDGGPFPPQMADDVVFDNLTTGMSASAMLPYVSPGEPDESLIVKRINGDDNFQLMPPPMSGFTLSNEEITTIEDWIENGAML